MDHCAPPDAFTFTQMMILLSKCRHQNSSRKALEILERVRNMPNLELDLYFFNAAFKAITSNPGYDLDCENLLSELENGLFYRRAEGRFNFHSIKPDKITYSTLMAYYAGKGTDEAAQKVEQLFLKLCTENKPDTYCLNTLIKAWCRIGTLQSIERAEALLLKSISKDCYYDGSTFNDHDLPFIDPLMKPNLTSFDTILQYYTRIHGSRAKNNTKRVQKLKEEYFITK